MRALVLEEYSQLTYKEMPEPQFGPDDVLIQVKASGICGSDVHGMDGSTGRRIPPLIMGHEAAGIITEAGANEKKYHPGQRITFDSTVYCGTCFFCRRGDINLCDHRRCWAFPAMSTDSTVRLPNMLPCPNTSFIRCRPG